MADVIHPAYLAPAPGYAQGLPAAIFAGTRFIGFAGGLTRDFRHPGEARGVISDTVVLMAGGVKVPFAGGRVWLLRLADGFKAWEGWSDASGAYTASGLETGVAYIAVGIDPYGNQKATAAGPVTAALGPP